VYGGVSPEVVAVQVKAFPDVSPEVGHDTVLLSGEPATFTDTEPVAVIVLPSLAVLLIE